MLRRGSQIPEEADIRAFLGKGVSLKGTLTFEGTVRVDGRLEGEVVTKDALIVGQDAEIKGEIRVGTLVSSGRIEGNVVATVKVNLLSPAVLQGTLETPVLTMEEGVKFDGQCTMTQREKKEAVVTPLRSEPLAQPQAQQPAGTLGRTPVQGGPPGSSGVGLGS